MLQKIGYLFDKKQQMQIVGLGFMILIGGMLETLGVSMMVPVVQSILDPGALQKSETVQKVEKVLHINITAVINGYGTNRIIITMLLAMMILFTVKNIYLLFQTYVQNTFLSVILQE